MLCVIEIAMTICGIIILVRGQANLTKNRVVTGAPAYVIGSILTATLPLLLTIGIGMGVALAASKGVEKVAGNPLLFLVDIVGVALIAAVCVVVALIGSKRPERIPMSAPPSQFGPPTFPPVDPSNPYQSPYGDRQG